MASDLLAATYGPIVTGILAGIGVAFREWRNQRSLEHKHKEILNRATRELTFLETWLRVHGQLGIDSTGGAASRAIECEILRLYEEASSTVSGDAIGRRRVTLGGVFRRIFVLKSPVETVAGILLRIAYYPFLLIALAVVSASSVTVVESFTAGDVFAGLLIVSVFAAGPVGTLRILDYWVASRARRTGSRGKGVPPPKPPGARATPYDVQSHAGR